MAWADSKQVVGEERPLWGVMGGVDVEPGQIRQVGAVRHSTRSTRSNQSDGSDGSVSHVPLPRELVTPNSNMLLLLQQRTTR